MPEGCDAACQKLILDSAMATVAAEFYDRVIRKKAGFTDTDYETPQLFIGAQKAFLESALFLNRQKKTLPEGAWDEMMEIADQNCYRAGYLIGWANAPVITQEMVTVWTGKLQGWQKSDQDFFVPLLKQLTKKD